MQIDTLILTCDRYSDLWDGFFYQFQKFYSTKGKVFFGCNELYPKNVYGREISVLHSGEDLGWESSFRKILNQIDSEYLLITLEDLYLNAPVNESVLEEVCKLIDSGVQINHVKCTNIIKGENSVGRYLADIGPETPYRVTLCGIWNRRYLLDLLKKGESPWDFEVNGSNRSRKDSGFYAVKTSILSNVNMVEKGLWIRSGYKWAIENQIPVTGSSRKFKSLPQEFISILRDNYFNLMMKVPLSLRMRIYSFIKKYLVIH